MRWLLISWMVWLLPCFAHAAVTINEVAWMGSLNSANDEWIELYNDGAPVDVSGWTLTDSGSLTIVLHGTIPTGSYAVLERTDDGSAPGTAFLVYTGALANTGATLTLARADGGMEDMIAGGTDWQNIGGDNVTKETAQYTAGGWITAAATPGSVNRNIGTTLPATTTTPTKSASGGTPGRIGVAIPVEKQELFHEPRTPEVVFVSPELTYVNQTVTFHGRVSGVADTLAQSMKHSWNFGDGATGEGKSVSHQYRYPGSYVIVDTVTHGSYRAEARNTITVLPTTLALTTNARGDVQLSNTAKYEVDVSYYLIVGRSSVSLPAKTFLLPNSTITIPRSRLMFQPGDDVYVVDPAGEMVARMRGVTMIPVPAIPPTSLDTNIVTFNTDTFGFGSDETVSTNGLAIITSDPVLSVVAPQAAFALEAAPVSAAPLYPYLGLAALIGIGLLGVIARTTQATTAQAITANNEPTRTTPFFDDRV